MDRAGDFACDLSQEVSDKAEWSMCLLGATIFVIVSKVTLLLGPLEKKTWYTELMTFLIALAMGTMFCVTIYQLIPEALELLHTVEYTVACETTRFKPQPYVEHIITDNCDTVCNASNNVAYGPNEVPPGFCTLQVGGSKAYVWIMTTLFILVISFYDLQKCLQYIFSNEDNTHMATQSQDVSDELNEPEEAELIRKRKAANRQQSIAMAARMKNIRTAVAFDIPVDEASQIANAATRRKYSLRKRSIVPTTNNMAQLARRSSLAVRKASIALANKDLLDDENDTDESWKKAPKKTKVNFAESAESDVVIEINQRKKVAFDAEDSTTEETTEESDIEAEGANYVKSHHRKPTGMPLVTVKEDDDDEEETDFDKTSTISSDDEEDHHKQDWSKVEPVAWVLLITISIECFIEGIAFSLTLKNAFGAGIAFLTAMLIKLVPQKLGDAVILSNAGLNHLWENLLSLFAVLTVYLGVVFGMAFAHQLKAIQVYFFAALSGIFLYISLASLFPVLQTIIEDTDGLDDIPNDEEFHKAHQKQEMRRLGLANLGFFVAMGLVLPLVYYEEDLQKVIQNFMCSLVE